MFVDTQGSLRTLHFPRPAAPFTYSNYWGGNMAVLTTVAFAAAVAAGRGTRRKVIVGLLIASIVPMVISLNRGMFISLGIGVVYVALRLALRGRFASLGWLLGIGALIAVILVVTPLGHRLAASFTSSNHGHSDTTRLSASQMALAGARQSPIFGYGEPTQTTGQGQQPPYRYPGPAVDSAVLERLSGSDLFCWLPCRGAVADAPGTRHGGALAAHRSARGPAADFRLRLAAGRVAGRDGRFGSCLPLLLAGRGPAGAGCARSRESS